MLNCSIDAEKVVDRLKTSSLAEDRRAAVLALKGLVREYKLDVGTKGLTPLCSLLQDPNTDLETLKAVLETLNVLCTPQIPDGAVRVQNKMCFKY